MINQLRVMGYKDKTINLLIDKEKKTFNIEQAIKAIAERIGAK